MNIGAVAKLTGLSSKSIRLYEEKCVISPPSRSDAGYREYGDTHVQELNLVSRAKNAGFSLQECKEFVELAQNPMRTSREVKQKAQQKLNEVEVKISQLKEIQQQLTTWINTCPGDEGSSCPIIEDLTK
ncbi:Cu(I)-responsive transcriptional regulator [Vibrio hepatarius]|uniref:Cu(I)-responsive transcriptional regulator n=1 Tax=Vibrio hepatarius TaxID=171383 RepID=UPI001C085917|nr:Cu(I)-responsive transcriptional regulator [Vibrio hepatarius]MBU2896234.1 Cu(I)-responsive transcriptional regulator [Vibrio hepatarius]